MHLSSDPLPPACAGCPGCPEQDTPDGPAAPLPVTGWRLAGWSAGIFLFPILTAAVGAGLAGDGGLAQLLGAGLGFALGGAGAMAVGRRQQRTSEVGA